jgi:hypothetical protein
MDSSRLGLRLGAEALGTFLFFFLGFNAIAVLVDIGGGAISKRRDRVRVRPWPRACDHGVRTHLRRPLQPRRVPRARRGAEVPLRGGSPVLEQPLRCRVQLVTRGTMSVPSKETSTVPLKSACAGAKKCRFFTLAGLGGEGKRTQAEACRRASP